MNLNKEHWQEKDYEEYLEYLKSLREEEYQKFHQKLTTTKYEILGLRVPLQRKIAMEISKGNIEEFLEFCQDTYYEEVNIEGFVLAKIKDLALLEKYFDSFESWQTQVVPFNKDNSKPLLKDFILSSLV